MLKQKSLNQIRQCLTEHNQIWIYFFNIKSSQVFQWLSHLKFLSLKTKVKPNNENEIKSDIFPWNMFKSDVIFFISKNIKAFHDFRDQNVSHLWLKWTKTMEMKQNQTFFHRTYPNLASFFIGHKTLKYSNDFYN